jgi:uncharacterized protein (DUF58 family)
MEVIALIIIVLIVIQLQQMIYDRFVFRNVEYECSFSMPEVMEGEQVLLVETIYNGKILPIPWIKAGLYSSRWLDFAGSKSTVTQDERYVDSIFMLKSHQKTTRRWKVKCLKRGIYSCRGTILVSSDIFGLRSISKYMDAHAAITVYPTTVDLDDLFTPASLVQGETIVRRWIIDDPFIISGTREYTRSDPMNRIHWLASAKQGRLMTRKSDFTSQTSMAIILNIQSMHHEHDDVIFKDVAELGIKISATLMDIALHDGYQVRFCSNAYATEMKEDTAFSGSASGREHISQLMRVLAGIELKQDLSIEPFLRSITGKISDSHIYFITPYLNRQIVSLLNDFKKDGNSITMLVLRTIDKDALDMITGEPGIFLYKGMDIAMGKPV